MSHEARVRLHAKIGDEIVPIAYCRHPQVRLLVREGQAVWEDGKFVLIDAVAIRHPHRHPSLENCYEEVDYRTKNTVRCLRLAEDIAPLIEAVTGLTVGSSVSGTGEVVLTFQHIPFDGWVEVWQDHVAFYLNREGPGDTAEQEIMSIEVGRVIRLGPTGAVGPDTTPRTRVEYSTSDDLLEVVEAELQVVAAILTDPKGSWLIDRAPGFTAR